MKTPPIYKPKNKLRVVTATSLYDGHDVSINIMRRIIQSLGIEVIHLGHNRSVEEIVNCAVQEDANAIAVTSYQGGHIEYFKYMVDLLKEKNASHIKIFGGGGGVILPNEIEELKKYGVCQIYSPDDGREMGLQGMINDMIEKCDFSIGENIENDLTKLNSKNQFNIAKIISSAENFSEKHKVFFDKIKKLSAEKNVPVLGITGTGGSGKSSLVDELVRRFLNDFPKKTIAIISVDPSKRKTGGALLGDRIRMNSINNSRVFMRSLATRQSNLALSKHVSDVINIIKISNFDLVILETSGIGQSDTEILEFSDISLYVMTPDYGAPTQLEKIDMIDFADFIALNKFDKIGAEDALRDVKKQYQRNHNLWDDDINDMPVFGTIASQFNNPNINNLYFKIITKLNKKYNGIFVSKFKLAPEKTENQYIIPPNRTRYLSEISDNNRTIKKQNFEQKEIAQKLFGIYKTILVLIKTKSKNNKDSYLNENGLNEEKILQLSNNQPKKDIISYLFKEFSEIKSKLSPKNWITIISWNNLKNSYSDDEYIYKVRGKEIKISTKNESLSHLRIPKISVPKYESWGDILFWSLEENVPGKFPYTAGIYPFKRANEDPTRMFAGEGGPERTNKRFHYLSKNTPAKRLSTAFDSVTLYGENPNIRPDIYGKIGNAGVSICCLDDAKKLYSGFDLTNPMTSVSMTINGPAPIMLAFFMNVAIDQECEKYILNNGLKDDVENKINSIYKKKNIERPKYQGELPEGNDGLGLLLLGTTGDNVLPENTYQQIKTETITKVRGTIQADILKEDQAQNTCIFSTEFAMRLMGDVQEYFNENNVRNFYSVSISGYHIAEAGANPITQLAFTLANGFTYVEYYLSRGMDIDEFAPNLSFFFSNGTDAEYAVIGRVARKIWAKALKEKYGANERAQMLKYHIQTSGRSLHAQEIDFNDIRTTLQALYAIYDNCNSLHTNAYDEAITTPTEESVRRAMAIQLIINKELGLTNNENPLQGSFIIEELTDLVEEAVYKEFDKITIRGGVLGAMETMYQRGKIQEESLYYETLKHSGKIPIIGVNTFLSSKGSPTILPREIIRSLETEKKYQIDVIDNLHKMNELQSKEQISNLQQVALDNENLFYKIMESSKVCSIGQITEALFEIGGRYRRNM